MTKIAKLFFRIKKNLALLLILSSIFGVSSTASGYVMPAEQILDFMVKNFSGIMTIALIQSTLQTLDGNEKVFTEQLWLESPDKYSSKALDRLAKRNLIAPDILYRQLFVANSREKIERILLPLGIDLTKTSYTRVDGAIAYRIGGKEPDSPKLIIEKKRFLPLLMVYRVPDEAEGELITVKFEDYRKEDRWWFPFEITYKKGESLVEKYTIQTFQANIPIDPSILKAFPEYELPEVIDPDEGQTTADPSMDSKVNPEESSEDPDIDNERLRNVIKAFEEQYQ